MKFLNIGPWELMVILAIAILVMGPKRMAQVARTIRRVSKKLTSMAGEFTATLRSEVGDVEDDLRRTTEGLTEVGQDAQKALEGISGDIEEAQGETRQSLGESAAEEGASEPEQAALSLTEELQAVQQETSQAVDDVFKGLQGLITGKPAPEAENEQEQEDEREDEQDTD